MNNAKRFASLLRSDFYKLGKMKSVYISLGVMLALILINYAIYWTQNVIFASYPELAGESLLYTGKDMLFGFSSHISIGLFMSIIIGIFVGGEFSNGITAMLAARGNNRTLTYLSKWVAVTVLTAGYVLFSFVVCVILTVASGYGVPFVTSDIAILIRSLALQLLSNITVSTIILMIVFLIRSKGAGIGVSLAVYFLSGMVIGILAVIGAFGESSAWLLDAITYFPSQLISLSASSGAYTDGQICQLVLLPVGYMAISNFIGIISFYKRDIK